MRDVGWQRLDAGDVAVAAFLRRRRRQLGTSGASSAGPGEVFSALPANDNTLHCTTLHLLVRTAN